jgi:hypothetical protein
VKLTDVDLEVKERSILAIATLLAQTGDYLPSQDIKKTILPLLVDRIRNEITRLQTVRALKAIADSPLTSSTNNAINLQPILVDVIPELASFLRKAHRQLRVSSLATLEVLINEYGDDISVSDVSQVLTEIKPLLVDSDFNIYPHALAVLCSILNHTGKNASAHLATIRSSLLQPIADIAIVTPHLVSVGSGLTSLLEFWKTIVVVGGSDVLNEAVSLLAEPISNSKSTVSKQVGLIYFFFLFFF